MRPERVPADHHWVALWLLLVGGAVFLADGWLGTGNPANTFVGALMGAGFVWLMLVD